MNPVLDEADIRLPTAFPLLTAIRKTTGKIAQKAGERSLLEATAIELRRDMDMASTEPGHAQSMLWGDCAADMEHGTVDYRNSHKAQKSGAYDSLDDEQESEHAAPSMGLDRELYIDETTGEFVIGKLQRSRSRCRKELRTIWEPYKAPELRWVRTTLSERVDNDTHDPRRDDPFIEKRIRSVQIVRNILNCLGPELFAVIRWACLDGLGIEEIGANLGFTGAQQGGAASAVLRIALLRAADVYETVHRLEDTLSADRVYGTLPKASNDNTGSRLAA